MGITSEYVDFCSGLKYEMIPAGVVAYVKRLCLDFIGNAAYNRAVGAHGPRNAGSKGHPRDRYRNFKSKLELPRFEIVLRFHQRIAYGTLRSYNSHTHGEPSTLPDPQHLGIEISTLCKHHLLAG